MHKVDDVPVVFSQGVIRGFLARLRHSHRALSLVVVFTKPVKQGVTALIVRSRDVLVIGISALLTTVQRVDLVEFSIEIVDVPFAHFTRNEIKTPIVVP